MATHMTAEALRSFFGDRHAARLMVLRSRYQESVCPPALDGGSQYPELLMCPRHRTSYVNCPCETARVRSLAAGE